MVMCGGKLGRSLQTQGQQSKSLNPAAKKIGAWTVSRFFPTSTAGRISAKKRSQSLSGTIPFQKLEQS